MAWKKRIGQTCRQKSSQVRCHDDPHLVDLAFGKLFIGWQKLKLSEGLFRCYQQFVEMKAIYYQF
jgi:hypothetical protein